MKELIGILVFIGLFFGGIFALVEVYGRYTCSNYAEMSGKKTKWQTLDVCYIQTTEGWQRWDEYLRRAAASEGLKAK